RARIEVERIAELVWLRRRFGVDARRQIARVVASRVALAERAEQIAERAIAEEVEALVGHLELDGRQVAALAAGPAFALHALGVEVGMRGDVAPFPHPLDDLLDQLLDLRLAIRIRRIAEQALERLLRQHAAAQQRFEDRVVQILDRLIRGLLWLMRIVESAR